METNSRHRASGRSCPAAAGAAAVEEPVEVIYDGGVQGKWVDAGWARRDTDAGKPAHVDFSNHSGWTLVRHGLYGKFTAVRLHLQAPSHFGLFLDMQLGAENDAIPFRACL